VDKLLKPKKKRKARSGDIVFEVGGVKIKVKESTITNVIERLAKNPAVRDTFVAIKNSIKPAKDDELREFIKKKRKNELKEV